MTINTKIVGSVATIAVAGALLLGATFAYFSATDTSTDNTLSTGTLTVNITDQNADTDFQTENLGSNWQPDEERLVNFDVKNTGSLPVNIRGFATGTWNDAGLDAQNKVKVTKVEHWNGAAWETLASNSAGITGYFYYSSDGTSTGTMFDVAAGGRAQLQLTVKLDETAGNDFQGKTFTATLQAEAKQTNAPSF